MFPASTAASLVQVRDRIARAADRVGRDPAQITLVAVTKQATDDQVSAILDLGVTDLGENRLAGLESRRERFPDATLHMIGHLQRNKARRAFFAADMFHAMDRPALARWSSGCADPIPPFFLQVNLSGEAAKGGVDPLDVEALVAAVAPLRAEGLMTMARNSPEPEASRSVFRALSEMSQDLRQGGCPLGAALSCGMTTDFEVAIEEGATHVRVGRGLFMEAPCRA